MSHPESQPVEKTGVLLINLGTPQAPTPQAVRNYLREFLMDRWVVDLPWLFRWLLIHLVVLRVRPRKSARLYQEIWTKEGSPLAVIHAQLGKSLGLVLQDQSPSGTLVVETAMRYGQPSLATALSRLKASGVGQVRVIPLYPQFATSTSYSSIEACEKLAQGFGLKCSYLPSFSTFGPWLDALASQIRARAIVSPDSEGGQLAAQLPWDHLLFSFHGLPEHQIKKQGLGSCEFGACCEAPQAPVDACYRAGAMATARGIQTRLGLPADSWSVSFQSRVGRGQWLLPDTEGELRRLAASGVKRVAVFAPSFVADCLETLEELAIRGKETFLQAGGKEFVFINCLNHEESWVHALRQLVFDESRYHSYSEVRKLAFR